MAENINSQAYWDHRFASGDWEEKQGRWQTQCFARGQILHLKIARDFDGTILDFGCGLGDAIPVYREHFPKARLMGLDISSAAIEQCRRRHGTVAEFHQGGPGDIPPGVDVIIASNVLEHLDSEMEVVRRLMRKCADLYVVVPYREHPLHVEHVRAYDKEHFAALEPCERKIFACRGWSVSGRELWYRIYFLNLFRLLANRPLRNRPLQILFHFKGMATQDRLNCPAGRLPEESRHNEENRHSASARC